MVGCHAVTSLAGVGWTDKRVSGGKYLAARTSKRNAKYDARFVKVLGAMKNIRMPWSFLGNQRHHATNFTLDQIYALWKEWRIHASDSTDDSAGGTYLPRPLHIRECTTDRAVPINIDDRQPSANAVQPATTECDEDADSDAVSDTSFTPPKNIKKQVRFDLHGHRHVLRPQELLPLPVDQPAVDHPELNPPRPAECLTRTKGRYTLIDPKGYNYLMPPPGFHGILPRMIAEPPKPKLVLKFEKKQVPKALAVACGGISLAVMGDRLSPSSKGKKIMFAGPVELREHRNMPSVVPLTTPLTTPPQSPVTPTIMPTEGRAVEGWQSEFMKGVFEAEEDLVFNGRLPVSTF
ncbi:hypothetical protein F4802DRAFT_596372 [Xylaria palmicola]|nr:hypothetical protein F4802DRAFT_596372 [Xylaria palmicola]